MPPRTPAQRIDDIIAAILKIQRYVAGLSEAQFAAEPMRFDAVARNLSIIGEAVRHLPADFIDQYPDLPWAEMRGLRNVLVHEYFALLVSLVWQTLHQDLFVLLPKFSEISDALRNTQ